MHKKKQIVIFLTQLFVKESWQAPFSALPRKLHQIWKMVTQTFDREKDIKMICDSNFLMLKSGNIRF